jgi:hypothetical protein
VIDQTLLAESLGKLDAGTRALLDLSLRRAIPDDQVAKVLGVDPGSIPPRRARGIAQLADMMEVPGPSELAALLIAIPDLPEEAWGVPVPAPFAGGITSARRAKAFRRAAIAASPLVALGAVMAAVLVSSSDHSGSGAGSNRAEGTGGAGGSPAVTAPAPDTRHRLPAGGQLSSAHTGARHARHGVRHHHSRHHAPGSAQPATLARQPVVVEHSVPVAFHPPAVVRHEPRHVTPHHAPVKHKPAPAPTPSPAPAPVQTPSPQPVSTPAPPTQTQDTGSVQQVSAPQHTTTVHSAPAPYTGKTPKSTPPQPDLAPPGEYSQRSGDREGGGGGSCGDHHGDYHSSQGSWHSESHDGDQGEQGDQGQRGSGRSFSPPGLFRRHH